MTDTTNNREQRRQPSGIPEGGQYASENMGGDASDLDQAMLQSLTAGMRLDIIGEPLKPKTPEETRQLLAEATRIEISSDGPVLYDKDDNVLYRQTDQTGMLDKKTLRTDPNMRNAVRATLKNDLGDMSAADRRKTVKQAFDLAGPYDRRKAIDTSPNRRYIPAAHIANSLRRRRDQEQALNVLTELHYEDANASANIIRAGYPKDKHGAFTFINRTRIQREPKDRYDKSGQLIARKGDPIQGVWTDKDGKTHTGVLPESKGAVSRAYLRMLHQRTNGVPTKQETDSMTKALRDVGDVGGPEAQAKVFWEMCYGSGHPTLVDDDTDLTGMAKNIVSNRRNRAAGMNLIARFTGKHGNGNAARMVAYRKALSHEAAVAFIAMEPGDGRDAHTGFTRRKRNKTTGLMENVKPKRLTEMRAYMRAVYQISEQEVQEYKDRPAKPEF